MSKKDKKSPAGKAADLVLDTPEAKGAGRSLARSISTVASAVETCLLPIAAMNYGYAKAKEYFETRFAKEVEETTKDISPEYLQEPSPSKVAPILQNLSFCHEEEELRKMYLELLGSTMDTRRSKQVHPAFAQIIAQLTPLEARYLGNIFQSGSHPIARIDESLKTESGTSKGKITRYEHSINVLNTETKEPSVRPEVPAMIVNWQRLGLVAVTYQSYLTRNNAYDWVKNRPEYQEILKNKTGEVEIVEGRLTITDFGQEFAKAIGQWKKG